MKRWPRLFSLLALLLISGDGIKASSPLRLAQVIPLPGVEGRIDHFGIDSGRRRLLIAALGNNTLNLVDLARGRVSGQIGGFHHPQGVRFTRETNHIFIANADDGVCSILDGSSFRLVGRVDLHDDADNIRYDPAKRQVIVGYGDGGLAILNAGSGKLLGRVLLAGHPELFQLESSGRRIFVNIPSANQVAIVDRTRRSVMTTWSTGAMHANFPMALDETHHRLLIGCRDPARLLVLDSRNGSQVASIPIDGDTDDLYYDPIRDLIHISCGEGFLDVIAQRDGGHYATIDRITTAPGARTSLFVPELSRIYVAVPHRGLQRAEIRAYTLSR